MMPRRFALAATLALASPALAAHGGTSYGSTSPSYGWRAIAGPTEIPENKDATNLQMMSRTPEFATDSIAQIKVVFPNFFMTFASPDSGAGAGPGAAATVTASIEYPAGTCTSLQFSGSASGTIPNGGTLASDALTIAIPNGATFWVREYTTAPSGGTVFGSNATSDSSHYDTADGEKVIAWASGGTDYTSSCTAPGSWNGTDYGWPRKPSAVVGWTQHPAVCLIGDSRTRGFNDKTVGAYNPGNHWGQFDRWLGPVFGTINLGANSDSGTTTVTNGTYFANRGSLLQYCTHAIYAYGINDFNGSLTSASLESAFGTMQSTYDPTHRLFWYVATVFPNAGVCPSGSSMTAGNEASRQSYNTDVRNLAISGQDGVIDIDAVTAESPWPGWTGGPYGSYAACYATTADTGLSSNVTTDGLHLNAAGSSFVANTFNAAPGTFAGLTKPKALFCADKAGAYRC